MKKQRVDDWVPGQCRPVDFSELGHYLRCDTFPHPVAFIVLIGYQNCGLAMSRVKKPVSRVDDLHLLVG